MAAHGSTARATDAILAFREISLVSTADDGGPCGIRTHDLRIKSPMLCQLS